jgi:hypothetical protein
MTPSGCEHRIRKWEDRNVLPPLTLCEIGCMYSVNQALCSLCDAFISIACPYIPINSAVKQLFACSGLYNHNMHCKNRRPGARLLFGRRRCSELEDISEFLKKKGSCFIVLFGLCGQRDLRCHYNCQQSTDDALLAELDKNTTIYPRNPCPACLGYATCCTKASAASAAHIKCQYQVLNALFCMC